MSTAAAIQPFANLDDDTEAALRASIKRFGVIVPIVVDQHGRIIDGHHRARIAKELNLRPEQTIRRVKDDDEANALAVTLNSDRRQMGPEVRRQVVADLRAHGFSLRAIGGAVGVHHTQVLKDLRSGGDQSPPEPQPPAAVDPETGEVLPVEVTVTETKTTVSKVTGRDGKSYPAKREVKNPERTREAVEARWAKVQEMAAAGYTSRQCADAVGISTDNIRSLAKERGITFPADAVLPNNGGGVRHIEPNRVVGETVSTVEAAAFALTVVPLDYTKLDREHLDGWVSSLSDAIRSLTTLRNNLKKELTRE